MADFVRAFFLGPPGTPIAAYVGEIGGVWCNRRIEPPHNDEDLPMVDWVVGDGAAVPVTLDYSTGDTAIFPHDAPTTADYFVEATFRLSNMADGSAEVYRYMGIELYARGTGTLMFGLESSDFINAYIDSWSYIDTDRWKSGGSAERVTLDRDFGTLNFGDGEHRFRIEVEGMQLRVYWDDVLQLTNNILTTLGGAGASPGATGVSMYALDGATAANVPMVRFRTGTLPYTPLDTSSAFWTEFVKTAEVDASMARALVAKSPPYIPPLLKRPVVKPVRLLPADRRARNRVHARKPSRIIVPPYQPRLITPRSILLADDFDGSGPPGVPNWQGSPGFYGRVYNVSTLNFAAGALHAAVANYGEMMSVAVLPSGNLVLRLWVNATVFGTNGGYIVWGVRGGIANDGGDYWTGYYGEVTPNNSPYTGTWDFYTSKSSLDGSGSSADDPWIDNVVCGDVFLFEVEISGTNPTTLVLKVNGMVIGTFVDAGDWDGHDAPITTPGNVLLFIENVYTTGSPDIALDRMEAETLSGTGTFWTERVKTTEIDS